ncbi:MAG TPA: hypothetical protein EYN51_00550, partial [Flavobacteriales bacterium]|nr:hypothetical protein [Flavobacteriales bacterium]
MQICRPLLICLLIGAMGSGIVKADDYYWVGGTGNWSDFSNHWVKTSGGASFHIAAPGALDDVYFDANSFSAGGQTVTVDVTTTNCRNLDWTGATNTPDFATSSTSNNLHVYGSFTLIPAMTFNFNGNIYFDATTTGHTITCANHSMPGSYKYIYFNGAGGGWTLQDSLDAPLIYFELVAGALNTNNQNLNIMNFSSSNSNVRSLILGSSTMKVFGWSWYSYNTTNFTFDAGTSTIIYDYPSGQLTFTGGLDFHRSVFLENTKINNSSNTFDSLLFSPGRTYTLEANRTQTINNYLGANGSCSSSITIVSDAPGTQATFSKASGAVTIDYASLKDIAATGGATFTANNTIDLSNNSGWTINSPTPRSLYWVGNTGNWTDPAHWALSSGGAGGNCVPNPGDDVYFDANSFSAGGQTVTVDVSTAVCNDMIWTGATNTPDFATSSTSNSLKIYGSLTLVPAMTFNFNGDLYFEATTTGQTLTFANHTMPGSYKYIYFQGAGGGWTLQDSLDAPLIYFELV